MKHIRSIGLFLMVLIISVSTCPVIRAESEVTDQVEWTYDNSMVVTVEVDAVRDFMPEDFPGLFCTNVIIVNKAPIDGGWRYTLILQFEQEDDYLIGRKIEQALQFPMVTSADRNAYVPLGGYVYLEDSLRYVPVGGNIRLQIADWQIYGTSYTDMGITFSIDTTAFGEEVPSKETLAEYGVTGIWPEMDTTKDGILLTCPSYLEGTKSETDVYYATIDTTRYSCIEVVDRLAN